MKARTGVVRDGKIPAGGIMDGADIAAVLHLGAAAAQLGAAFVDVAAPRVSGGD
jgi:NAD(P)H-dependent flavin oxidoreductase YrpB (nitropropane dioxygenase family)